MNDSDSQTQNSSFEKQPHLEPKALISHTPASTVSDEPENAMVIDDSDSENFDKDSQNKFQRLGCVIINFTLEPRPSFLGTDASNPMHQLTLTNFDWAHKEMQQEKEWQWAGQYSQMGEEKDKAVRCISL